MENKKKRAKTRRFVGQYTIYVAFVFSLILSLAFVAYSFLYTPKRNAALFCPPLNNPKRINSITLHTKGEEKNTQEITLPTKIDSSKEYFFHFRVPKNIDHQYVAMNIYYTYITLKCKDKVLYTNRHTDDACSGKVPHAYIMIPIPCEYNDKELTLEFSSSLTNGRKIKFPVILLGSKQDIIEHYIKSDNKIIFYASFLIILGIHLILFAIFLASIKHSTQKILALAFFAIFAGMYVLLKTWTIRHYMANTRLSNFLEYTCIIILPLPVNLLFLSEFYKNKYTNWRMQLLEVFSVLVIANLIIQYLLVFTGLFEFIHLQVVNFFLLLATEVSIVIATVTTDKTIVKNKNHLMWSIVPMTVASILVIINYYMKYRIHFVNLIVLSTLFFILIHIYLSIKNYLEEYNRSIKNEFYSELAYKDILTNLKNRNSLEMEIENIKNGTRKYRHFELFMIDMNDLKFINDHYGHIEGDKYIRTIGNILLHMESIVPNLFAYRFAGDEFIILCYDKNKEEITQVKEVITNQAKEFKGSHNFELSLAIGHCHCNNKDNIDFENILHVADKRMYKDKHSKKWRTIDEL